jgi:hypothetical protein
VNSVLIIVETHPETCGMYVMNAIRDKNDFIYDLGRVFGTEKYIIIVQSAVYML